MIRRAVFVDRDGVINELVPDPKSGLPESPLVEDEVVLIPGAADALRRLAASGLVLVGVSNQPAAAKGKISTHQLQAVHDRVISELAAYGVLFDDFRICPHHPSGVVPELTRVCDCRKPAPGMLLDAARTLAIDLQRSWMVGDTDADIVAGHRAGCQTLLIGNRLSVHKRGGDATPDGEAPNLIRAAELILQ